MRVSRETLRRDACMLQVVGMQINGGPSCVSITHGSWESIELQMEKHRSICEVAYRLTPKGKSLRRVLAAVMRWGLQNIDGTAALLKPD